MSRRDQKAQRKINIKENIYEETDKFLIDNSPPEFPQNEQRAPTPDQPSTSKLSENVGAKTKTEKQYEKKQQFAK